MERSLLNPFRLTVLEKRLNVYGIVVHREGEEDLSYRWRSDDAENLYSGSKTFTSLGVGICSDAGGLRLEDRVLDYFPAYRSVAAEGSQDITVRDLLHMASGKHAFWPTADQQTLRTADWAELFFKEPLSSRPGTHFFYSNACTYMLGRVIETVTGQTLRDYLVPRLFEPLGIYNPQWHTCPQGHTIGASDLYLTTGEFARLGELLLGEGVYREKRIVSAAYLERLRSDIIDNNTGAFGDSENQQGYGYQVWRCTAPGTYRADGMYGQFSIVVPQKRAVITVTSHEEVNANDIIRAVFADIVPILPDRS